MVGDLMNELKLRQMLAWFEADLRDLSLGDALKIRVTGDGLNYRARLVKLLKPRSATQEI